jgi:hypothetical protein
MTVDGICLYRREQLIAALESGRRFCIAYRMNGEWNYEGYISLVHCNGDVYIRGDQELVPIDDLGNLAKIRSSH